MNGFILLSIFTTWNTNLPDQKKMPFLLKPCYLYPKLQNEDFLIEYSPHSLDKPRKCSCNL